MYFLCHSCSSVICNSILSDTCACYSGQWCPNPILIIGSNKTSNTLVGILLLGMLFQAPGDEMVLGKHSPCPVKCSGLMCRLESSICNTELQQLPVPAV